MIKGALVLMGVAIVVAALFFWQSRPRAVDDPAWRWSVDPVPAPSAPQERAQQVPAPGSEASVRWLVHVVGRVRRPGVVALDPGARVADAVRAAGGLRPGTDPASVNLARPVSDGEQLVIGGSQAAPRAPADAEPGERTGPARVDLNTADAATLEALDGIGPVLAERIVEWRRSNGRFTRVEDLRQVSGIGPRTFEALADQVTV